MTAEVVVRPATSARGTHLQRASAPLRAGRGHGLEPGTKTPYSVELDGRRAGMAVGRAGLRRFSTVGGGDYRAGQTDADGVRVLPGQRVRTTMRETPSSAWMPCAPMRCSWPASRGPDRWPDLLLFLGDQVYADETSDDDARVHRAAPRPRAGSVVRAEGLRGVCPPLRAGVDRPSQPLAAVDASDRHDLRRTRHPRRLEHQLVVAPQMEATSWWHDRVVGGLASYWIYQHLGNLGPDEASRGRALAAGRVVRRGGSSTDRGARGPGGAGRPEPECYRWSYARDFDTQAR